MAAAAPALSPVLAPAPGPLVPVTAPAQPQQPVQSPALDTQAAVLEGVVELQGQNVWPFSDHTQAALQSALAAAMPAVLQDQVKILDTVQASTIL